LERKIEVLLWSIALPSFSQLLNGKYIKGIIFIFLEFIINIYSNFNEIILMSFNGNIHQAIETANYQWLMFYPCLYFFGMWDAFKDAGGGKIKFSFVPFVFLAYFVTLGCIYSPKFKLFGIVLGPVWLSLISVIPGFIIGMVFRKILLFITR